MKHPTPPTDLKTHRLIVIILILTALLIANLVSIQETILSLG